MVQKRAWNTVVRSDRLKYGHSWRTSQSWGDGTLFRIDENFKNTVQVPLTIIVDPVSPVSNYLQFKNPLLHLPIAQITSCHCSLVS